MIRNAPKIMFITLGIFALLAGLIAVTQIDQVSDRVRESSQEPLVVTRYDTHDIALARKEARDHSPEGSEAEQVQSIFDYLVEDLEPGSVLERGDTESFRIGSVVWVGRSDLDVTEIVRYQTTQGTAVRVKLAQPDGPQDLEISTGEWAVAVFEAAESNTMIARARASWRTPYYSSAEHGSESDRWSHRSFMQAEAVGSQFLIRSMGLASAPSPTTRENGSVESGISVDPEEVDGLSGCQIATIGPFPLPGPESDGSDLSGVGQWSRDGRAWRECDILERLKGQPEATHAIRWEKKKSWPEGSWGSADPEALGLAFELSTERAERPHFEDTVQILLVRKRLGFDLYERCTDARLPKIDEESQAWNFDSDFCHLNARPVMDRASSR